MYLNTEGLPTGETKEDKKQRKRFIKDFYRLWESMNPEKKVFNKSLQNFINVKYISVDETTGQASHRYKSTLAVMFLTEILENAVQKGIPKNADLKRKIKKDLKK